MTDPARQDDSPDAVGVGPIDLVFTWVDGADPAHEQTRRHYERSSPDPVPPAKAGNGGLDIRYCGVGEITYAVRSVLEYLPWVRTIHIVTDGQRPPVDQDVVASGRVRVVDHAAIVPDVYRPVFASTIIESCLHRIPGLSETFLYNNDDFLHFAPVPVAAFAEPAIHGGIALRLRGYHACIRHVITQLSAPLPSWFPRANPYTTGIANAARLLRTRARLAWPRIIVPRHVTAVYRRSTLERIEAEYADALATHRARRFKTRDQLSYATLAYSLEWHWHPEDHVALWGRKGGPEDMAMFDFLHRTTPARCQPLWDRVLTSHARFACLNNVPQSERDTLAAVMRAKGLGHADVSTEPMV